MTDRAGDHTVIDLIDDLARRDERPSITFESAGGEVVVRSVADVVDASRRLAAGLGDAGIGQGDRVLVHLNNRPETIVTWLATLRLGAIYVPSNPVLTPREIGHMTRLADVRAAICDDAHVDDVRAADPGRLAAEAVVAIGGSRRDAIDFARLAATPGDGALPGATVRGDDVAALMFTSGTTSAPKAAIITHANCVNSGLQKAAAMELTTADRVLTALPFFHVNAQSALLAALTAGASFVMLETYSARRFCDQLAAHGATVTSLVSTQVRTLLRRPAEPADRAHGVRRAWFALGITDDERDEFLGRFGIELFNGYGLTEAYTSVCQTPLRGDPHWPSVGRPLPGREVRIVLDGSVAEPGTPGEIVVGGTPGRTLMGGYWADPDATASALRDGWLHTGDIGWLDADGFLHFVGRKADMIKRAGENIAAAEVEAVLREHDDVDDAAVIGVPDPIRDEAVKAYVVLRAGAGGLDPVIEHAHRNLAAFKVPTEWAVVDELPRTSIGKVHKAALRGTEVTT